jgi:hypothetical protein
MNKHVLSHQSNNKNEIRKVGRSVSLNKSFEKIENMVKSNSNPEGSTKSKQQISKQFGKGENIVTIVIRFTNPNISSLTEYRESLMEPLKSNEVLFHKIIKEVLPVKISLSTKFLFYTNNEEVKHNIQSHPLNILTEYKIDEVLDTCFNFMDTQIQERYFQGSGLSLKKLFLT